MKKNEALNEINQAILLGDNDSRRLVDKASCEYLRGIVIGIKYIVENMRD